MIFPSIQSYIEETLKSFDTIPEPRKALLVNLSKYITDKLKEGKKVEIIYICTHNSRRSHFGQIWAQVAAAYYDFENVFAYSGGTEATAFNPNAIQAVKNAGFEVNSDQAESNPRYTVKFNDEKQEIICFSKAYDDSFNPKSGFCAVMTCSDADENCPLVLGAEARVATTYEDPKAFDNTPRQEEMYDERYRQIARESFYAFSLVKESF